MYRGLNIETLGISGRQSELIELVLTYRFKGLDVDMETLARQADKRGLEYASRFIASARKCQPIELSSWELPVHIDADDELYKKELTRLPAVANTANAMEANRCYIILNGGSHSRPMQENFDFHRDRLTQISELLAPHEIRLGVGFRADAESRKGTTHQFITKAEELVALVQAVASPHVGLMVDSWHWYLGGGTVEMIAGMTPEQIVLVRLADAREDLTAEIATARDRLVPGSTNVVPNAELLTKLYEMEFDGPVVPFPNASLFKTTTRDRTVQQVTDMLKSMWPGLEDEEAEEAAEDGVAAEGAEGADKAEKTEDGDASSTAESNGEAETAKASAEE